MGMLSDIDVDESLDNTESDRLGGSYILESDVYNMVISMAYVDKSKSGSQFVRIHAEDKNKNSIRDDIYFAYANGKTYKDGPDGRKTHYGFTKLSSLCQLAADKAVKDLNTETKSVNVFDWAARKEVPQEKEVITDLIGKPIRLGIQHSKEDKQEKNDENEWVNNGKIIEKNVVDKMFRASDGLTATEIKAEATKPDFMNKWIDKNRGEIKDTSTGKRHPSLGKAENTTPSTSDIFSDDADSGDDADDNPFG